MRIAIFATKNTSHEINQAITTTDHSVSVPHVGDLSGSDLILKLQNIASIDTDAIIIDIDISTNEGILKALTGYRMQSNKRIFLVALNRQPGDAQIANLVQQCWISDIIAVGCTENGTTNQELINQLSESIQSEPNIANAMRWQQSSKTPVTQTVTVEKLLSTIEIAIGSTHSRSGTTTQALFLAQFLKSRGHTVAYVEAGSSRIFPSNTTYNGIDVYTTDPSKLPDLNPIRSKRYDYILIDCGSLVEKPTWSKSVVQSGTANLYQTADLQLLATGQSEWDTKHLANFLQLFPNQQARTICNLADANQSNAIKRYAESFVKKVNGKLQLTFYAGKDTNFEEVMRGYLPTEHKKKKWGIF